MRTEKRNQVEWAEYVKGQGYEDIIEHLGYDPAGCEHCSYGIVAEPDTEQVTAPLWLRRAIAASRGAVLFCGCRVGQSAERQVGKNLQRIPAYMLTTNDKSALLVKNEKGGYSWSGVQAPAVYVPSTTVRAVLDVIEAAPTIHMEREAA